MRLSGTSLPRLSLLLVGSALLALGGCTSSATRNDTSEVIVLATASEMVVGENRFPFGLLDADGQLLENATAHVRFYLLRQDGMEELRDEAEATFLEVRGTTPHLHADGELHLHEEVRGVYVVAKTVFDESGIWRARMEIGGAGSSTLREGSLAFQVVEQSATLVVGDPVPPSQNPTARDVQKLEEITTHSPPLPGLYQLTVAEALDQDWPFVVAFATPAFCVSRMCGPVTDVVAQLYKSYGDRVNFIHIEPWELNSARTEGRLVMTDVALEWDLPSEPWVFVVDAEGALSARFEGLVGADELADALEGVLQ